MADTNLKFSLHDLKSVNTVLGMLYDKDGNYRPGFKPEEFYNTILLDTLKYGEENYVHLKYAETVNIRKGERVARFRRWSGMTPTLRPLKEGIPPAPDKHAYEYMEVGGFFSFGRWSEYTDAIDKSIISELVAERSVQYGENANQTKELYARSVWLASPNDYFANFKAGFADLAFGDSITIDDLRFLSARMKRMQVKPISGKMNYICSPEFINGLIDDPRVKTYMEINQTTGNLWSTGECFPIFDLNFIPTMLDEFAYPDVEYPGVYNDGAKDWIRLYAVDKTNKKIYYLDVREDIKVNGSVLAKTLKTGLLPDGTAIEDQETWEVPNTFKLTAISADGIACKTQTYSINPDKYGNKAMVYDDVTAATSNDLDAFNKLIANGDFNQLPVHRGILFGDEAMIKLNFEGLSDQPRIIIKALGSAGVLDPLDQRQSVGYRVDGFGLAIKRPEAICVTYGIPTNAEFAALTAAVIGGDPTGLIGDDAIYKTDTKGNTILDSALEEKVNNTANADYAPKNPLKK